MRWSCLVCLALLAMAHVNPGPASAQGLGASPSTTRDVMTRGVSLGIEGGGLMQTDGASRLRTVWLPSVQVGLGRRFAIQWEASRWSDRANVPIDLAYREAGVAISPAPSGTVPADRTETTVGVNLRYRVGSGRWLSFVGGGVNVRRTEDRLLGRATLCDPPSLPRRGPPQLCIVAAGQRSEFQHWDLVPSVVGGGEFQIAGPLTAVGSVRVNAGKGPIAVGFTGGVRVALQPQPVSSVPRSSVDRAVGKDVRITANDGSTRIGRLLTMSKTHVVVVRQGQEISVPLDGVRNIERVSHGVKKGALIGLATGIALAFLATCDTGADDCPNKYSWVPVAMLVEGGIGAAAGAGIGAIVNAAQWPRNQLYSASSTAVSVAPLLGKDSGGARAGLRVGLRF